MNAETLLDQAEGLVSAVGDEPVAEPQAAGGAGEAAEGRKRTRFLSEDERKRATELLMAGHSVSSIAKVLNRSIPTISRVKKEVLSGKSWNEKRTKKRKSKFDNPDTIAEVTEAWHKSDGELTYDKIAGMLKCSTSTAWAFVKAQGWRRPQSKKKRDRMQVPAISPTSMV